MSLLYWIILGAAAGWLASIVMGTNKQMGLLMNIIVGIVGSAVGGYVYRYLGHSGVTGFDWHSLGVAFVGSLILIGIFKLLVK